MTFAFAIAAGIPLSRASTVKTVLRGTWATGAP